MRSSELADIAGVSVRTLRHYHQIGLLPEPPRTSAGYRTYRVEDVVRLVRIRKLTDLGIPLSDLPAILDDPTAAEDLLDTLDREAAEEIARLEMRRDTIAALRRAGSPPDLPPGVHRQLADASGSLPPDVVRFERDLLILLGHLLGDDGPSRLAEFYGVIDADADSAVNDALTRRLYDLQDDASDQELLDLVEDLTDFLRPKMPRMAALVVRDPKASALLDEFSTDSLNSAQRRVLRRVDQRIGHLQNQTPESAPDPPKM